MRALWGVGWVPVMDPEGTLSRWQGNRELDRHELWPWQELLVDFCMGAFGLGGHFLEIWSRSSLETSLELLELKLCVKTRLVADIKFSGFCRPIQERSWGFSTPRLAPINSKSLGVISPSERVV